MSLNAEAVFHVGNVVHYGNPSLWCVLIIGQSAAGLVGLHLGDCLAGRITRCLDPGLWYTEMKLDELLATQCL